MNRNFGNLEAVQPAWWLGIVEAIGDDASAGRYKVRIFGYHTADREKLPTKDLPWAVPINPVTSAAMNGIMDTPALVNGSTVVGAFLDGEIGQTPVVFGSIAGVPAERDFSTGFSDPDEVFPREASSTSPPDDDDGGGILGGVTDAITGAIDDVTSAVTDALGMGGDSGGGGGGEEGVAGIGEPDISRLARGEAAEAHFSLMNRRDKIKSINEEGIPTAKMDKLAVPKEFEIKEGQYKSLDWKMPDARGVDAKETVSAKKYFDPSGGGTASGDETSVYPFNLVKETSEGIIKEYDNSPANVRICEYHPANTWYEVHNDGSRTTHIQGSEFVVVKGAQNVYIEKDINVTTAGNYRLKVGGDYVLEVEGNKYETVKKDHRRRVTGNDVHGVAGSMHSDINGSQSHNIGGQLINVVAGVPPGTKIPETYGVFWKITNGIGMTTVPGDANKGFTLSTGGGPFNIKSTGFNVESANNIRLEARDNFYMSQTHPENEAKTTAKGVEIPAEPNVFKVVTKGDAVFEHSKDHITTIDVDQTETIKGDISLTGEKTRIDKILGQDTLKIDNLDIMKHDDGDVQIDLTGKLDATVEVEAGTDNIQLTTHVHGQTGGHADHGDIDVDTAPPSQPAEE